jgi:hypothetical protein
MEVDLDGSQAVQCLVVSNQNQSNYQKLASVLQPSSVLLAAGTLWPDESDAESRVQ